MKGEDSSEIEVDDDTDGKPVTQEMIVTEVVKVDEGASDVVIVDEVGSELVEAEVVNLEIAETDAELVEVVYTELFKIFSEAYEKAALEAGKYLIKAFYEDDIERARKKDSPNRETLNKLIDKLQDKATNSPSKSWIYQSISLVVQEYDLKGIEEYAGLSLSHKCCLLSVKDLVIKKQLIEAAVKETLSVSELEERKKEAIPKNTEGVGLITLLNRHEGILHEDVTNAFEVEELKKVQPKKLRNMKAKALSKAKDLQEQIDQYKAKIGLYEDFKEGYIKLEKNITKAIKFKTTN